MAVLFSDELQMDHYGRLFSRQGLITYFFIFMTIFMPFVLIVPTHNFLITDTVVYEQPQVRHLNELLVAIYTPTQTYTFGSTEKINKLLGTNLQTPEIEIESVDFNHDGRDEEIQVNINVAGINPAEVKQIMVMQSLSYAVLTDDPTAPLEFKLPIVNSFQTPYGFSKFKATGQLELGQKAAFAKGHQLRMINYDKFHLAESLMNQPFSEFLDTIQAQNTTLHFKSQIQQVTPALGNDRTLEIRMNLQVPLQQPVRVKVSYMETFKLAYLQYISFLILTYIVLYKCLLGWAYERKLFGTQIVSEIHKANMSIFSTKFKTQ